MFIDTYQLAIVKVSHVLVLASMMALSGSSSSYITCLDLLALGGRPYKLGVVCSFGLFLLIYSICLPDFFSRITTRLKILF